MLENVVSRWNYDQIVAMRRLEMQQELTSQRKARDKWRKEAQQAKKKIKIASQAAKSTKDIQEIERLKKFVAICKEGLQTRMEKKAEVNHNRTIRSHPILIGPATLDGLLLSEPDRYDYITKGQFPFDNLFFEFMEPVARETAYLEEKSKLVGLQLNKDSELDPKGRLTNIPGYNVTAYYETEKGAISMLEFRLMDKQENKLLAGTIRTHGFEEGYFILGRPDSLEEDDYIDQQFPELKEEKAIIFRQKEKIPYSVRQEDRKIITDTELINQVISEQEAMFQLAVNLVNYVNAQNVTVKAARKFTKHNPGSRKGRKVEHNPNKQYHIVGIDSREVEHKETDDENALQFRVYVRGHNRRYRDNEGNIQRVTWVTPHVRGPEGAPWKEHRYAVLAGMLEREKKMVREYLPH